MAKDIPFQILLGLVSMTLLYQTRLPIFVVLYISIMTHGGIALVTSCDVTSYPHLHVILTMVAMEIAMSCYCIVRGSSHGLLLIQGIILSILQTIIHLVYLTTSQASGKKTLSLGDGKGRKKLKGSQ